ncbi:MAG: VanW family protein [Defluviitaleaceae bacterium]|nr:VanW family protein [Defluviitaleaceae bacterium]
MNMRKLSFFIAAAIILLFTACSNTTTRYTERRTTTPQRSVIQRRSTYQNTPRENLRPSTVLAPTPSPAIEIREYVAATPQPTAIPQTTTIPQAITSQVITSQAITSQEITSQAATPQSAHTPRPTPFPSSTTISQAPIKEVAATMTSKQELATHSTNFNADDENRKTNITRASNTINGHVVQPGETFSYNETVGPTIERRGYKESVVFVDGEKEKGFGGGVCQVSTTLSIAADNAGMTITERHDHSRPVTYANEGEEAATSYGGIDFKFKNEKSFPIVIQSSVQDGTITVSIREA